MESIEAERENLEDSAMEQLLNNISEDIYEEVLENNCKEYINCTSLILKTTKLKR